MPETSVNEDFIINLTLTDNSREELREKIVNAFLSEKGGYWKDGVKHVTHYRYYVETLNDDRKIFLLRPTYLNKGIDFQVWVEKFDGIEDKRPSHKDIFQDLKIKKKENPDRLIRLIKMIDEVWKCQEPDLVLRKFGDIKFKSGLSVELILKILKWLFIEQDITYWNYDGRGMLKKAIEEQSKN